MLTVFTTILTTHLSKKKYVKYYSRWQKSAAYKQDWTTTCTLSNYYVTLRVKLANMLTNSMLNKNNVMLSLQFSIREKQVIQSRFKSRLFGLHLFFAFFWKKIFWSNLPFIPLNIIMSWVQSVTIKTCNW